MKTTVSNVGCGFAYFCGGRKNTKTIFVDNLVAPLSTRFIQNLFSLLAVLLWITVKWIANVIVFSGKRDFFFCVLYLFS